MQYLVGIREVWVNTVLVEAESEEKAIEKAGDGDIDPDFDMLEYSHSLDSEVWSVEKKD